MQPGNQSDTGNEGSIKKNRASDDPIEGRKEGGGGGADPALRPQSAAAGGWGGRRAHSGTD